MSSDAELSPAGTVPLVVDMDGTLVRVDTLHEAVLAEVGSEPLAVVRMAGWLSGGRAGFKRRLADRRLAPAEGLPLNEAVLELLREARAEGRRTVLVTAADRRQAEAVAARTGLFDEVHGTDPGTAGGANLSGRAKADFLADRFGRGGFDYVGDARVDLPVWAAARRAVTVGAPARLRAAAEAANPDAVHLAPPTEGPRRLTPWLRALRPHQWSKNLLIFAPALAAHDMGGLGPAAVAFVAFSLVASAVYVLNDLLDLAADRAHPRKRARPFAAAEIPAAGGVLLAGGLLAAAVLLAAAATPTRFLAVLAVYFAATCAYSLVLKRRVIIDILTLAGLYTLRVLAGAAAAAVALSPWMLAFSVFVFLALAAVKRQAELTDQAARGQVEAAGRGYRIDDLPIMHGIAISAGNAAVLVFALYIYSPNVRALYVRHELLWLICPLMLYWLMRMVMITHRGRMHDDPIVFAASDRVSQAVGAAAAAAVLAATLA